ncbi:hypothetical protein FisN_7Hh196 [Fistulifera solaris]|uniref:HYR domain-containing protein n=1 Tax=Fistulifera solaris TaxID=1519565 RepID=A0A1Z5K3Q4_FISSO|nr:hypothetical protein FisN_7Hh196 [Fistulifera solaris]|eukprot:GAX20877.1 hypothetical protein FisN_7Hh196 [Fistulifera solaris]
MLGYIILSSFLSAASAAITATVNSNAAALAANLLSTSGGATLSNAQLIGAPGCAGFFTGGSSVSGLTLPDSGVILSSGNVVDIAGPNNFGNTQTNFNRPGDSNLDSLIPGFSTLDACVLQFDFQCGEGEVATFDLTFDYVFGSEEYLEFVGREFNDVFGFFLNGINIALLPDNVTPVSINSVNQNTNSVYFNNNSGGTFNIEADGLTTKLTAQGIPTSGTNTIKLAVADAGDRVLDSWVLIEGGSFSCVPNNVAPVAQCQNIEVSAISLCEHSPPDQSALIAAIDNDSYDPDGSIASAVLDNYGPYPFGDTTVVLTVTDDSGAASSCEATITVVDDESISSDNLDCGGPGVIAPPNAPLNFFPSYIKTNGCPADLTVGSPSCSFCNGAAKTVDKLAGGSCQVGFENHPANFSVADSGGVGDHIAWTNTVCDSNGCAEFKCTVCVTNPSNKGAGGRRLRDLQKFTCPSTWNPKVDTFKCGK